MRSTFQTSVVLTVLTLLVISICIWIPHDAAFALGNSEYHFIDTHSESDIRSQYDSMKDYINNTGNVYETEPIVPLNAGKLSDAELKSGLYSLNFIRYIAGVSGNFDLDTSMSERAQSAAMLMASTGECAHYVNTKPSWCSDNEYFNDNLVLGASSICSGSLFNNSLSKMAKALVNEDGKQTGHRNSLLETYNCGKIGFGTVNSYGVFYDDDDDKNGMVYGGLVWPAREQPIQFFNTGALWNCLIPADSTITKASVKITDVDNNTQTITSENVNISSPAWYTEISFSPGIDSINNGDKYNVKITNVTTGKSVIEYNVHFFDLDKAQDDENNIKYNYNEKTYCDVIPANKATFAEEIKNNATQHPSLKVLYQGKQLVEGTDYTFDNSAVKIEQDTSNTGYVKITITLNGIGKYHGTMMSTIRKIPDIFTESTQKALTDATVLIPSSIYTYTGTAITPEPTVTLDGETLTSGTDYTVSYSNNTSVGTATITITGKGSYTGTKTTTFEIIARETPVETIDLSSEEVSWSLSNADVQPATYYFTGSKISPALTVTVQGSELVKGKAFAIAYYSGTGSDTKAINADQVSAVGTYTIKIKGSSYGHLKDSSTPIYTGSFDVVFYIIEKPSENDSTRGDDSTNGGADSGNTDTTTLADQNESDADNSAIAEHVSSPLPNDDGADESDRDHSKDAGIEPGNGNSPNEVNGGSNNSGSAAPPVQNTSSDTGRKVGDKVTAGSGASKALYRIVTLPSSGRIGTVWYIKSLAPKSSKRLSVPATVKIDGVKYYVTAMSGKSVRGYSKLTSVTIGKNVKALKAGAFKGAKKLKTLVIKTKKLTKKTVRNSLRSSKVKRVKVQVSSSHKKNAKYKKKYAKIFTKANAGKAVATTA